MYALRENPRKNTRFYNTLVTHGGAKPNMREEKENQRKVLNLESKCNKTKSIIKKFILNRATQNQLTELD